MATYQVARMNKDCKEFICIGNYTGWSIDEIFTRIQRGDGYYFMLNCTSRRVSTYQLTGGTFKRVPQPKRVEHLIKEWKEFVF